MSEIPDKLERLAKRIEGHEDAIGNYWPEETRPEVGRYNGFIDVDLDGCSAHSAVYVASIAQSDGFEVKFGPGNRISISPKPDVCASDGCYALEVKNGLCAGHERERKHERMKSGLPPQQGVDY